MACDVTLSGAEASEVADGSKRKQWAVQEEIHGAQKDRPQPNKGGIHSNSTNEWQDLTIVHAPLQGGREMGYPAPGRVENSAPQQSGQMYKGGNIDTNHTVQ